jgi:hypothetical protein
MKTARLNIRTKMMILSTVLLASTLSINSQQLAAANLVTDLDKVLTAETSSKIDTEENLNMEDWMNNTNWISDSAATAYLASEEIVIEDWMLESFELAEEEQLETEDWMVTPFDVEEAVEEELELEDWMLDAKQW